MGPRIAAGLSFWYTTHHHDYENYYTAAVLQLGCVRGYVRAGVRVCGQ